MSLQSPLAPPHIAPILARMNFGMGPAPALLASCTLFSTMLGSTGCDGGGSDITSTGESSSTLSASSTAGSTGQTASTSDPGQTETSGFPTGTTTATTGSESTTSGSTTTGGQTSTSSDSAGTGTEDTGAESTTGQGDVICTELKHNTQPDLGCAPEVCIGSTLTLVHVSPPGDQPFQCMTPTGEFCPADPSTLEEVRLVRDFGDSRLFIDMRGEWFADPGAMPANEHFLGGGINITLRDESDTHDLLLTPVAFYPNEDFIEYRDGRLWFEAERSRRASYYIITPPDDVECLGQDDLGYCSCPYPTPIEIAVQVASPLPAGVVP